MISLGESLEGVTIESTSGINSCFRQAHTVEQQREFGLRRTLIGQSRELGILLGHFLLEVGYQTLFDGLDYARKRQQTGKILHGGFLGMVLNALLELLVLLVELDEYLLKTVQFALYFLASSMDGGLFLSPDRDWVHLLGSCVLVFLHTLHNVRPGEMV